MKKTHSVGVVFTISLICIFAILSSLLVFMGVEAYKQVLNTQEYNNESRTTLSYLAGKVRTAESADSISITDIDGIEALAIADEDVGRTLIYEYDGYLCEAYVINGFEFELYYGENITRIKDFEVSIDEDIVNLSVITESGYEMSINIALRR